MYLYFKASTFIIKIGQSVLVEPLHLKTTSQTTLPWLLNFLLGSLIVILVGLFFYFFSLLLGKGNFIFGWTGSRENYFGSVGQQQKILSFRISASQNKKLLFIKFMCENNHMFNVWFSDVKSTKFLFFNHFTIS